MSGEYRPIPERIVITVPILISPQTTLETNDRPKLTLA